MLRAEHLCMRFFPGPERGFTLKQGFVELLDPRRRSTKKPPFTALDDLSFTLGRGEVLGLVGSNGAGKSTLLKLAAGVYKPSAGRMLVYGRVCPMIELGAGFDPELSGRENVFLNGAVMGYSEAFLRRKFDEIAAFSGLEAFLDAPLRTYSSGMTARLAFSVATVVEPEILIVDEILSVGDLAFQRKSEEKMLSMIRGGTTVLFVSHDIGAVRKLCGRALWLEKGRLRALGEAGDICDLYEESLKGGRP
ncbi:MAG: ABC transporter ATP-binding protein [Oscillospiraceae bacterium]|nr:ABC transporter ATP-binding protein [Oscillospiraceae bacterium]